MKYIVIGKSYIEEKDNKAIIYNTLTFGGKKHTIWFGVDKEYSKYLCTERNDAYLIGILNYAMRNNYSIKSETPITEDLLYNLRTILIPSLSKYGYNLFNIKIEAEMAPALQKGTEIGTGLSCGIDSFDAIKNHINSDYPNLDVTYFCINNVGAFNECYKDYGEEKVKEERYEITRKVAKELGIKLIETDSNFGTEIIQNHLLSSTYSTTFAIYMLQKFWKIYYLGSSGLDYSTFEIKNSDLYSCEHYELLSLQCFSIQGLKIYSEGGEKQRIDKTRNILDFEPAQKYLHVCIAKPYNDNVCSKCMRTLTTLDALDSLDKFNKVFDINYYNKNKKMYYKWALKSHYEKYVMNEPTYQLLNERKDFRRKVFLYRIPLYLKTRPHMIKDYIKSKLSVSTIKKIKKLIGKK